MRVVLAVDDSLSIRETVKLTLDAGGYKVLTADSGLAALRICETETVDVVITDLNMPELDGITLIRRLRSLPAFRFTPILMLTTESQQSKKMEGKSAGASGWIVKPFTPDQLTAVVRKVCPE